MAAAIRSGTIDTRRPDDADAVRASLRAAGRATVLPVLFGGVVDDRGAVLSGFVGTRSVILRDLLISADCGLGGRTIAERRAGAVSDYFTSTEITHDYDREVSGEGIESLIAAPAVVDGRTRAVLYGALRSPERIGDRVIARMVGTARQLAHEIEVRDEVDRRVAQLNRVEPAEPQVPATVADAIVESYVALREIAATTTDEALAGRLRDVEERLRGLGSRPTCAVTLSPRERDVLAHLALGCANAEIAERLSLRPETIKSYVRNLMGKLEVHNRREAVVTARRMGLLP
ncbi:LuxR C-terminal-related transcriptional regulator [Gordonia sp. VNQ95]|jgi:DNA-binding CsgD family transcriptional regulator|uniref:helix-turn-helix transcriptional regulator n=1 Tax=Gordonia TaxID=2053 RepID=UPI0032B41952